MKLSEESDLSTMRIPMYGSQNITYSMQSLTHQEVSNQVGDKQYELANHLGNVLNVVTDRKLPFVYDSNTSGLVDYFTADVKSYSDYYPFGMQLPNRHDQEGGNYRYGFQGQEKDDELKGEGNSLNYEYRMHDPRIGRFFAIDPLSSKYPFYSPYAFSGNRVIDATELEGLEPNVLFESADAAAINFGQYYNDNSIRHGSEIGVTIYKIVDKETKKTMYAYTLPNFAWERTDRKDNGASVNTNTEDRIPEGGVAVATAHTHGSYVIETDNEFSLTDINNSIRKGLDA